ncbi:hypothetical protein EAO69_32355, partial [Streptomyces sp. me109]
MRATPNGPILEERHHGGAQIDYPLGRSCDHACFASAGSHDGVPLRDGRPRGPARPTPGPGRRRRRLPGPR